MVTTLLMMAPLSVATAVAQPPEAAELLALERALAQSLGSRDRTLMERLLADDFVLRSVPDVDRAMWMSNALALCWGDRFDISDFRAERLGETAVTSFVLTFYVDPVSCQPAVLRSLVTDVWTLQVDGWRLRVRHAGPAVGAGVAGQFGVVPLPPPSWEVQGELSFVATGGNTSTRTLGMGGVVGHRRGASATRVQWSFLTSAAEDVLQARSLTADARQGRRLDDRLEVFGRAGYARDRFAGIAHRGLIEGGLALTPSLPPRHAIVAEGTVGFTAENRLAPSNLRFAIATGALGYAWQMATGTELAERLAFTADLQTGRNWRATNTVAFGVAITRVLSLKLSHAVEYRHLPVPGFRRADLRAAAALVVSFERRPPAP